MSLEFKTFKIEQTKEIEKYLNQHGRDLQRENLMVVDNFVCILFNNATDEEKNVIAVLNSYRRELTQKEVDLRHAEKEEYLIRRKLDSGKGAKPDDLLDAKEKVSDLQAHISYLKEKITEIEIFHIE